MPVEAEDAAERLKPERIGEAPEHLARAELADEINDDLARQAHHAREEPGRRLAAVERQRSVARVARHVSIVVRLKADTMADPFTTNAVSRIVPW